MSIEKWSRMVIIVENIIRLLFTLLILRKTHKQTIALIVINVSVVVQFYLWFKFSFLLFQTHNHVFIIHSHTQQQKKIKFEPRIKLNHNTSKITTVSEVADLSGH